VATAPPGDSGLDHYACVLCLGLANHVDHIVPIARGEDGRTARPFPSEGSTVQPSLYPGRPPGRARRSNGDGTVRILRGVSGRLGVSTELSRGVVGPHGQVGNEQGGAS
jgi:hypothetical protein